jgi:branched-chain amino acid transport system ATP-binding protein
VALLRTENLTIKFGGLCALSRVDIQVSPGELLGLIGPNGSGKSTLFNIVTGIYQPTQGKVMFENKNIAGVAPYRILKAGIARTFQNTRLFSELSVLDNVLVGMYHLQKSCILDSIFRRQKINSDLRIKIDEALELISYFSTNLVAHKYKRTKELSTPDKKKIEVCRAIASKPKLLLLDEPAAGMTPEETNELIKDIAKIREKYQEMSIILVEHDMRVMKKIAEKVIVLNYGEKIFEGTFENASMNKAVREAYLGKE